MADAEETKPDVKPIGDGNNSGEHINLKVTDEHGAVVNFKIKRNTPLRKLMNAYCERQGIQRAAFRFIFDGAFLGDDQTPQEMNMEDDDTIELHREQIGGGH